MARSSSSQQPKPASGSGATCEHCGAMMKRTNDLPRHMILHAKNKEEFMYSCPVEGCTHQTLQKSNLATHIRTHTRARPHKCPEYFPNGQKCDFATADPSSLHRHRKRRHGYKPRSFMATSSTPTASGSGTREASVSSSTSFESEESFGLRPESSEVEPSPTQGSTDSTLSDCIRTPYFPSNKVSANHYVSPYYPPLDLKVPDYISSPVSYGSDYPSSSAFPLSVFTSDILLLGSWPELIFPDVNDLDAAHCYEQLPESAHPSTSPSWPSLHSYSTSVYSPLHFHEELATFSPQGHPAFVPEHYATSSEPFQYLLLPSDLFPVPISH
ncbi:hypothetical protein DFH09DRAFT_1120684 [Mycena vulgaris]|nr:hypothetical protein DFH09DRAFT_1120684 [Mycena vulgaris]